MISLDFLSPSSTAQVRSDSHGFNDSEENDILLNSHADSEESAVSEGNLEFAGYRRKKKSHARSAVLRFWSHAYSFQCLIIALLVFVCATLLSWRLQGSNVCTSSACVLAASELLRNIHPNHKNLDPCADFWKFSCGGWDARHQLSHEDTFVSQRSIMQYSSNQLLRRIVESLSHWKPDSDDEEARADAENVRKVERAYMSCMDDDRISQRGLEPLKEIIAGMPRITSGDVEGENRSLTTTAIYLSDHGVEAFVSFHTKIDDRNPDINSLLLRPVYVGRLVPSREYYLDPSVISKYKTAMSDLLKTLLKDLTPTDRPNFGNRVNHDDTKTPLLISDQLIDSVVDLEMKLAVATPSQQESFENMNYYNPLSLVEAQQLLPHISLRDVIAHQISHFMPEKVVVVSSSYIRTLDSLLRSADDATLQVYLIWRVVQTHVFSVRHEAMDAVIRFSASVQGQSAAWNDNRWKYCLHHVNQGLGWILGRSWVKWHLPPDAKIYGHSIISTVRDAYVQKIRESEWLSAENRHQAAVKLQEMAQEVAYPKSNPDLNDPVRLRERYASVDVSDDFFENVVSFSVNKMRAEFAKLAQPVARKEWDIMVDQVNAWYSPSANKIIVPAGIMQAPVYYGPRLPRYLNFGAFGAIMGHELSHAFDSYGRFHSSSGDPADWWSDSTKTAFDQRTKCFVDQFNAFDVTLLDGQRVNVNGTQTLNENLADIGGLKAAYQAWLESSTSVDKDLEQQGNKLLPGLEIYTKEQMFFLAYGNWWCSKSSPERMASDIKHNRHAPHFARVLDEPVDIASTLTEIDQGNCCKLSRISGSFQLS